MNNENLVSIHPSVQYWIGLYGKNNNISYRNTVVIENLTFIFNSSVLNRVIWKKIIRNTLIIIKQKNNIPKIIIK
jgi:hypothetical protein